jgi:O-antigen/teichoic acid export membrane protein
MDPDKRMSKGLKRGLNRSPAKIFSEINSGDLLKNIWQVSSNSILIALIVLAFNLLMSRKLGPADYGSLSTLLTVNSAIIVMLTAICLIITRFIAYYNARQQPDKMKFLMNWSLIFFAMVGFGIFLIIIMFCRIISEFLNIDKSSTIIIFGVLVWVSFLTPIIEGILRGLQDFKRIGYYKMADAILKLIVSAIIIFTGFGIGPLLVGIAASSIITLVFAEHIIRRVYISRPYKIVLKEVYGFALPVFLCFTFYAALQSIDLILVKHFFDPLTAGFFAASAMLAKIVLSMAFGSGGVMFPKAVEYYGNGNNEELIKTLKNTLKITLIPGTIITIIIALFPNKVTNIIFGPQYEIGAALSIYVIAMLFLAASTILMIYDLAVNKYRQILAFFAAAFITTYQIIRLHSSIYDVAWALFIINLMLLTFMILYNKKELFS